jgi:hypothetical protein
MNGEYAEALEMTGTNIDEFKKFIRTQISSEEKKADFVTDLSSKRNGADVSSGFVYKFLNLFLTPGLKHLQMIALIYNHEYQKGPLSPASLSSAAKIPVAQVLQYIRILEGTGAIELGFYKTDTKREKMAIKSKDKDILDAWFGEYLDIDETGAQIKDGGVDHKVAGIDLRTLTSTGALTAPASHRADPVKAISLEVLQSQWADISKDIRSGNMPYERVADYVAQCNAQDAKEELSAAVDYIAVILRMEEFCAVSTPQQMKDILACIR